MKRALKTLLMLCALLLIIATLTACGGSGLRAIPNANRIQEDLAESGLSIIPTSQTIDNIEIIDYETDRDAGIHIVSVVVHSHDEEASYIKYGILSYRRNADREWILSAIDPDRQNLWSMSPLVGTQEAVIEASLHGLRVTIDGDEWQLDGDSIENVTVNSQNTQLENRRDTVVATVILGSDVLTAQGQVELTFVFDGGWFRDSYRSYTPFVSEYRPHAVLDLSTDNLLDEIIRETMTLGSGQYAQTISLSREEISNLSIEGYISSNKGTSRVYDYSFTLTKGIVVIQVEAQATYRFDNMSGWLLDRTTLSPTVTRVNFEGTRWVGTYREFMGSSRHSFVMEITGMASDGTMRVEAHGTSPTRTQVLAGAIDLTRMTVTFRFEEWIVNPGGFRTIPEIGLNGRFDIETSTMRGSQILFGGYNEFELRLDDGQSVENGGNHEYES